MLLSVQGDAHSAKMQFVDQLGQPVNNVVVSFPGSLNNGPKNTIATVDQINKQFSPHVLIIEKGQSVNFPNSDDIRHHIYSFSKAKPFEIRLYKASIVQPIQFNKGGIVVLGCNIHDQMVGYIYIADNEVTALSDINGMVNIQGVSGQYFIWHPRLSASGSKRESDELSLNKADVHLVKLKLLPVKTHSKKNKFKSNKFSKREK